MRTNAVIRAGTGRLSRGDPQKGEEPNLNTLNEARGELKCPWAVPGLYNKCKTSHREQAQYRTSGVPRVQLNAVTKTNYR